MKPIFATGTPYGCYQVRYGYDPRLYHRGINGRIAIDETNVTLQYRRPILHERILQSIAPAWLRFFIFAYVGIFPIMAIMAAKPNSMLTIPLLLVIVFLLRIPRITQRTRIEKAKLTECRRIGGHRLWLVGADEHDRLIGFYLDLQKLETADAVWQALTTPGAELAAPAAFSFATERLPWRFEYGESGVLVGEGTARISAEEFVVSGMASIPDPVAARRISRPFKLTVMALFLLFVSGVALDAWGLVANGIIIALVFIGLIVTTLIGLRTYRAYTRQRIARPRETRIPLDKIRQISLGTESITMRYSAKGGGHFWTTLYAAPAVQDEMARLLAHREAITDAREFAVRLTPGAAYDYYGGFFGRGMLTLDGDEVVFSGRRLDSEPHGRALWAPTLVVYALLVYFMAGLYPLLLGGVLPEDMKPLVILAVPLAFQLLGQSFIIAILPFFIRRVYRVPVDAIADVRRIGCQLSLTFPDLDREPTRLTLHTRTLDKAAAVESALNRR